MSIDNYKSHLVEELGWATWDSNEKKISQLTLRRITGMSFWLMLGYIVLLTERTGPYYAFCPCTGSLSCWKISLNLRTALEIL